MLVAFASDGQLDCPNTLFYFVLSKQTAVTFLNVVNQPGNTVLDLKLGRLQTTAPLLGFNISFPFLQSTQILVFLVLFLTWK